METDADIVTPHSPAEAEALLQEIVEELRP